MSSEYTDVSRFIDSIHLFYPPKYVINSPPVISGSSVGIGQGITAIDLKFMSAFKVLVQGGHAFVSSEQDSAFIAFISVDPNSSV